MSIVNYARSVRLVHAGDAEEHTPRIADGRREAHPRHAQIRVTGKQGNNPGNRSGRWDGDHSADRADLAGADI